MSVSDSSQNTKNFPPPGWVTSRQAAQTLGVSLEMLTCSGFKYRPRLRGQNRLVRNPQSGGRCSIYPAELIERVAAAQAEEAAALEKPPQVPEGFCDREGAAAILGVSVHVWNGYVTRGMVRFGELAKLGRWYRTKIYPIEDVRRLKEQLADDLRRKQNAFPPPGWVTCTAAAEMLGVGLETLTCPAFRYRPMLRGQNKIVNYPDGGRRNIYRRETIERIREAQVEATRPPYADPQRPGVWRVPLAARAGRRREVMIDADAVARVAGWACYLKPNGTPRGFVLSISPAGRKVALRRLVLGLKSRKVEVTHVNGDPLDCRRQNLAVQTLRRRQRRARKIKLFKGRPPTSRYKGVHWAAQSETWRASIRADDRQIVLGSFDDEVAAAEAYDEAARKYFGADARPNFPDEVDGRGAARVQRVKEDYRAPAGPAVAALHFASVPASCEL